MDEIALINSVQRYKVLYNPKNADYNKQTKREEAWQKVGQEINHNAEEAKEKWNKLRRCFCNALNRRRNKVGRSRKKFVCWKYEQNMKFLLPYLESRLCQGSTVDVGTIEDFNLPQIHEVDIKVDVENSYEESPQEPKSNTTPQSLAENKDETSYLNQLKFGNNIAQLTSSWSSDLDETDLFFLSMGRMTKSLPRSEQSKIKLLLSNAVLEADIQNQERITFCTNYSSQS